MFESHDPSAMCVSDANGSLSDSSDNLSVSTTKHPELRRLWEDILGEDSSSSNSSSRNESQEYDIAEKGRVERCINGIDGICTCLIMKPLVCSYCKTQANIEFAKQYQLSHLHEELHPMKCVNKELDKQMFVDAMYGTEEATIQRDTALYSSFAPCFIHYLQATTEVPLEEEDFLRCYLAIRPCGPESKKIVMYKQTYCRIRGHKFQHFSKAKAAMAEGVVKEIDKRGNARKKNSRLLKSASAIGECGKWFAHLRVNIANLLIVMRAWWIADRAHGGSIDQDCMNAVRQVVNMPKLEMIFTTGSSRPMSAELLDYVYFLFLCSTPSSELETQREKFFNNIDKTGSELYLILEVKCALKNCELYQEFEREKEKSVADALVESKEKYLHIAENIADLGRQLTLGFYLNQSMVSWLRQNTERAKKQYMRKKEKQNEERASKRRCAEVAVWPDEPSSTILKDEDIVDNLNGIRARMKNLHGGSKRKNLKMKELFSQIRTLAIEHPDVAEE